MSDWIFIHSKLDDSALDPISFRIIANIARRCGKKGAYASINDIAKVCRICRNTVKERLRQLRKSGWVIPEPRSGETTVYRLPPSPPDGLGSDRQPSPPHGLPPSPPDGLPTQPTAWATKVIQLRTSIEGNPSSAKNTLKAKPEKKDIRDEELVD